jgi:biopolymer transport protein ExbB
MKTSLKKRMTKNDSSGQVKVMNKSPLYKILFLTIALVVLLAAVFLTLNRFKTPAADAAKSQRLIDQFFTSGGVIVWFIQLPLSLITVFIAAQFFLTIRRSKMLPDGLSRDIIEIMETCSFEQLHHALSEKTDLVSVALSNAASQSKNDLIRFRSLLAESLQDQTAALLRKIEWLNLIGNVSPMIGLFGTVVGMIQLFNAIVQAGGQPQPVQLAHGISVALVTTFWGLLTAIPALSIHGLLRNRIESIVNDAVGQIETIMPSVVKNLKKQLQTNPADNRKVTLPEVKTAKTLTNQPLTFGKKADVS